MKYDGDGRATARLFSGKGCRRAPLFTAPADAARHKRCLWSVSRVRRARDGRFYRSRLPAPGKDRAPVALKGAALTRRPFHYADVLMGASVSSCLSFVCY
ncbi:hypothetical protein AML08_24345 [Escherichia coli]|nr:hypothetical protein AML05_23735 [Escherichia coli]KYR55088.1 hypothetical protein AML08_24345 [Escherichia coli]KYR80275.1 hypothetical protein AML13_15705 [Escherichia coli]GEE73828.1 hypothetical protein EC142370_04803 [Escherichia coli O145:H34]